MALTDTQRALVRRLRAPLESWEKNDREDAALLIEQLHASLSAREIHVNSMHWTFRCLAEGDYKALAVVSEDVQADVDTIVKKLRSLKGLQEDFERYGDHLTGHRLCRSLWNRTKAEIERNFRHPCSCGFKEAYARAAKL